MFGYIIILIMSGMLIFAFANRSNSPLDYFVASRQSSLFELTCSYLSTNIGGGTIVTLVSIAFIGGFAALYVGISYSFGFILLSLLAQKIKSISDKTGIVSIHQYSYYFYESKRIELAVFFITILSYFLFLCAQLLAISYFVASYMDINLFISILISTLFIAAYSLMGGLKVDIRTDILQTFLIVGTIVILLAYMIAYRVTVDFSKLSLSQFTGTAYRGYSFIIVTFLLLGPSLIVSMDMWQRILAAKDIATAKNSLRCSSVMILLVFSFFTFIGIAAYQNNSNIVPEMALIEFTGQFPVFAQLTVIILAFASITSTADSLLVVLVTSLLHILPARKYQHNISFIRLTTFFVAMFSSIVAIAAKSIIPVVINAFLSVSLLIPTLIFPLIGFVHERAAFYSLVVSVLLGLFMLFVIPDIAFVPSSISAFVIYFSIYGLSKKFSVDEYND